jgi:hypothetical protein
MNFCTRSQAGVGVGEQHPLAARDGQPLLERVDLAQPALGEYLDARDGQAGSIAARARATAPDSSVERSSTSTTSSAANPSASTFSGILNAP